jgi:hypothetical protein
MQRSSGNGKIMLIGNDITGTTLVLIASDAFEQYMHATGGVPDRATGLLRVTLLQFAVLENLFFIVNGVCILSCLFSVELHIFFVD